MRTRGVAASRAGALLAATFAFAPRAGAAPTISSADDQAFVVGLPATPIATLTIGEDAATPAITALLDLRVRIPSGFSMTWDASDSTAVLGGSAAAKVSATVAYEDGGQTLVLDVIADFAAAEQLTVAGLSFTAFGAASAADNLELEVNDDGAVTATDDKTIVIWAAVSTNSSPIDVSNDGAEVWVANPDHGTVSVISTATNTRLAEVPVGGEPWTLDVHPTNGEVWVASLDDHHVYILDAASRAVVDSIAAGFETFGVCFNPTGTRALVTATGSDQILAIDVASRSVLQTMPVFRRPRGIVWNADGSRAWVTHLLTPDGEFFGRLTTVFPSTWTTAPILLAQVFHQTFGGYPHAMQGAALAPGDQHLWIPSGFINTTNGLLFGNPLTPLNTFHACIRPVNVVTSTDLPLNTYYLSEGTSQAIGFPGPGATPVGGPIAVAFKGGAAFVANLHSDDVTVLDDDILNPVEVAVIPVGNAPIGVAKHPTNARAYVANWLSRDVTVLNTFLHTVVTTVPATGSEVLSGSVLNGKQLFFTSRGPMSLDGRGACASCHVFGTTDGRDWDLSQFGKHIRSTPDARGIKFTGPHDWSADKDEMQDHNFGILEFTGGVGLLPGGGNPPLGAPNAGLSQDMDDIGAFMETLRHRPETPYLLPGGVQTANADSGEVLFNDPAVGCASCHSGPFYTDSVLQQAFVKHDVGTADSADADGAAGFDTPSLVGAWDTAPYLHSANAKTLRQVMTTFNPNDEHGTTSQLTTQQIDFIAEFINSIGWPDEGVPTGAGETVLRDAASALERAFPNPFHERTSLRFSLERSPTAVRIDVFDVQGRRVRTLLDRTMTRGTHLAGWDSRDDRGRLVAAGAYFARLTLDGKDAGGKKLVVLH
jgi:YVTN family beta-propeller protein